MGDEARKPWWVLQDAGGDIVALCDNGTSIEGAPFVAAQWTYDAYGSVVSADHLSPHPFMHAGHKGLFFDRLDVGVADSAVPGAEALESPRLVPFAHALYHNRNRVYNPQFGRFMQADPNASGFALIDAAAYNGRGIAALAVAFDFSTRYGDGANLYEYLGSNPWNRFDPMGLSWDPFDMVDEYVAEAAGERAALLSALGNSAKAAAIMAANIATYLPFPAASLAGELALAAMGEQDMETALLAAGIGLIPGGKLLGPAFKSVGRFISRAGASAFNIAKRYVGKGVRALWAQSPIGLMHRASKWMMRKRALPTGACPIRCFAAGTLVWTASGLAPIETVCVGDLVFGWNETTGQIELGAVTGTTSIEEAALIELSLLCENGNIETLQVTDDHPFYRVIPFSMPEWVAARSIRCGDLLGTRGGPALVESVKFSSEQARVYNLSVAVTSSYYVGHNGVLAHNCNWVVKSFDHLLGKLHDHKWGKVFGTATPTQQQLKTLVDEVMQNGVESVGQLQQFGLPFEKTLTKDGNDIVVRGVLRDDNNAIEITTAFVR